ncbi:hypothetical protein PG987_008268 [Apiospora arundinis]
MLQRIAASRGRSLPHAYRAAESRLASPFTTLTKAGVTTQSPPLPTATRRSEAGWKLCPRATVVSSPAARSRAPGTETYRDFLSSPDIDLDHIQSDMTCTKFRDSIWGFVIYRCSQGNEAAWLRLLQALRNQVQESLRFYIRQDMLESHDLHVIDDETLRSGATSHQVRDHFRSWVQADLEDRLRPDAADLQDDVGWWRAVSTPRYEYCLFVDELCLESVDHPGVDSPVVKLLHKNWESPYSPQERNYNAHAPFHDGSTEYDEEDVGWMYMPVQDYLGKYSLLGKATGTTNMSGPRTLTEPKTKVLFQDIGGRNLSASRLDL